MIDVNKIAEKVVNEPLEEMIDELDSDMDEIPQHVIDEELADAARQRTRELRQMDMYNDEMWNWRGLR